MAYQIDSTCIGCGACMDECPVGCIEDQGGVFHIKESECIDCGACEGSCPNGSIKAV
ncbi:MAG: 4Fe-4S binding protein [Firmicutes bacterium]|nr:4Fe-4S binding protein [Bacillota bacterium]